jgi:hypothetical protein
VNAQVPPPVARMIRTPRPPQLDTGVRDKLAWPVVAAYWLLLAAGVALYTIVVGGVASQAMWIGALLGSLLGHALALRNVRLWFVLAVLCGVGYLGVFASPGGSNAHTFWLTFVPAVMCAYASLADRWALAACWLPTVTWMLTILDRTHTTRHLDALAIVLLAILVIAIVVFMRVRETRRVALWQSVGATPLAAPSRPVVLTEMPAAALGRVVWNLAACGLAAAMTLWLAPRLWQLEEFHRKSQIVVVRDQVGTGLPCCQDCLSSSSRVAEYLDLGRGHDRAPVPGDDCRICSPQETARLHAGTYYGDPYIVDSVDGYGPGYVAGGYEGRTDSGYGYRSGTVVGGSVSSSSSSGVVGDVGPSQGGWSHDNALPDQAPNTPPRYEHDQAVAPQVATTPVVPDYVPPPPTASIVPPPTPPAPPPAPRYVPPTPPPAPAPAPPQASSPPVLPTPTTVPPAPSAATTDTTPPSAPDAPSSLPHVLVYMLVGVLSFRAFTLLLRPLRRALVVRHLRAPLWPETVDQRVSNAWQLALVGLRDAGFRCDGKESPREFAHRVGVDGLDRCATILERTRYGVAIDADDLADMQTTAHAVYGTARQRAGGLAQLSSLLRWPLT